MEPFQNVVSNKDYFATDSQIPPQSPEGGSSPSAYDTSEQAPEWGLEVLFECSDKSE